MDSISLSCPNCKEPLKFPAAQAGGKGDCVKCGARVAIPAAPADDEDEGGAYGILNVIEEKKVVPVEKKKEKKTIDPSLRRKKKIQDADKWNLVRGGLTIMSTAAAAWAIILGLQMVVVLIGCTRESEYNPPRLQVLLGVKNEDDIEKVTEQPNRILFALSLIYGAESVRTFQVVQIILALASIFPVVLFLMGYFAASRPPKRFGMRGQVKAMMILAIVNVTILVLFRILPMSQAIRYAPLPYLVPELPLLNANSERYMPIHVIWMYVPFMDVLLTIVFICCQFAECTMGGVFIYTIGYTIKDEETKNAGIGLIQLAMGAAFAYIVYHLASLCGCSEVLVSVLRVMYLGAVSATFGFILLYMKTLSRTKAILDDKMADMTAEEAGVQGRR